MFSPNLFRKFFLIFLLFFNVSGYCQENNISLSPKNIIQKNNSSNLENSKNKENLSSSKNSPRVVITNGMVIPNYSKPEHWEKFYALGVSQYGAPTTKSTTQCQVTYGDYTGTLRDFTQVYFAVLGS